MNKEEIIINRAKVWQEREYITKNIQTEVEKLIDKMCQLKAYHLVDKINAILYRPDLLVTGQIRKFRLVMSIMKKEEKEVNNPIYLNCNSYQDIYRKYSLCTFMIRRIEIELSEESVREAIDVLKLLNPSNVCLREIIEQEYFERRSFLYYFLYEMFSDRWSPKELLQWKFWGAKYE